MQMGADSNPKATPIVVKLNKALKLAEAWVNNMSTSTAGELNELQFEGRPSRLGLGAKVAPNAKSARPTDPVERKLLAKINAGKKSSCKDSRKGRADEENGLSEEEEEDEPESRTNAVAKKRALPFVTTAHSKKQK